MEAIAQGSHKAEGRSRILFAGLAQKLRSMIAHFMLGLSAIWRSLLSHLSMQKRASTSNKVLFRNLRLWVACGYRCARRNCLVLAHCGSTSKPGWQKSRCPLCPQLRSMVPQIRTSAYGLLRAFMLGRAMTIRRAYKPGIKHRNVGEARKLCLAVCQSFKNSGVGG
jgi:hypothetical protein